jgi:hypothetical protein
MTRYETDTWKELESIQNSMTSIDILTITAFMDDEKLQQHLEYYREVVRNNEAA